MFIWLKICFRFTIIPLLSLWLTSLQAILLEQHSRIDELLDTSTNDFILHLKQTDELGRTPLYFAAQYGTLSYPAPASLTSRQNRSSEPFHIHGCCECRLNRLAWLDSSIYRMFERTYRYILTE